MAHLHQCYPAIGLGPKCPACNPLFPSDLCVWEREKSIFIPNCSQLQPFLWFGTTVYSVYSCLWLLANTSAGVPLCCDLLSSLLWQMSVVYINCSVKYFLSVLFTLLFAALSSVWKEQSWRPCSLLGWERMFGVALEKNLHQLFLQMSTEIMTFGCSGIPMGGKTLRAQSYTVPGLGRPT